MLRCREIVELASDFLERRLRLRTRWAVLVHVAMCRGCRAFLEQVRLTVLALASLPHRGPDRIEREALLRSFREARGA